MSHPFLDFLKEMFQNIDQITPEKVQKLTEETSRFFHELQEKMKSSDPKEREEGRNLSLEIKQALEAQMSKLIEMTGMNPEQLAEIAETQLGEKEKEAIASMKADLQKISPIQGSIKTVKKQQPLRLKG